MPSVAQKQSFNGADEKLQRVLTCDPGIGVLRHADAGYPEAINVAEREGLRIPMHEEREC